ncbi:MAG: VOC family protein [Clostridiales bacterium]|nr:VOC family protein [Clostridiales bacterium]
MIINHITYSVSDITEAVLFYNKLFGKSPIAYGEALAYYDLDGIWFALNQENVSRVETYSHVAFFSDDLEKLKSHLGEVGIRYELGRLRHSNEFVSIYIRDMDMNLIEFHTGNLKNRLLHYKEYRDDIKISEAL